MSKHILFIVLALMLTACETTKVVREPYPVLVPYVPEVPLPSKPVIPQVAIPESPTAEQRGQLVHEYAIRARMWKEYAELLEATIVEYNAVSKTTEPVKQRILEEVKRLKIIAEEELRKYENL